MMVFRSKQIVILVLILMVVVAGYLQYTYKKNSIAENTNENERLGEAAYVEVSGEGENVSASKEGSDYFAQAKLQRDQARSEDNEILKSITEDPNADKATKAEAFEKMMQLVANSEKETNIEILVKEIGFEDVLVLFGEDGSVDVRVKAPSLTSSQVAQISDIVSRQANVEIDKIFIKYVQ